MNTRCSLAAASLLVAGFVGCAAPSDSGDPSEEVAEDLLDLDVTVDALDIVHGALRLSATMVDGGADVSVRLGRDCVHGEVGGGISTPSMLVWALGENDVAEAMACNLVVRARVRQGPRIVTKTVELAVEIDLVSEDSDRDDAPTMLGISQTPDGIAVGFSTATRSPHLTAGDSILFPVGPRSEEDPATSEGTALFVVPRDDFARSILRRRPLSLDGVSFKPQVSVAGVGVQDDPVDSFDSVEIEPEDEMQDPPVDG
jgi:hypothetical protein